MTSEELYYEIHLLINKNNSQQNINIEKPHFVQLFNRECGNWLYEVLNNKNKDDSINDIQELLISDIELQILEEKENYNTYTLPIDFFNYLESNIIATKKDCSKKIFAYNIHPKEVNVYLQDEFSKPSFEWEETISTISNNSLLIYKDFSIDKCFLSYYKEVDAIELEGYIKLNGEYSKDINSNLSNVFKRQILDRVAKELTREFENVQAFQLSQERLQSEK